MASPWGAARALGRLSEGGVQLVRLEQALLPPRTSLVTLQAANIEIIFIYNLLIIQPQKRARLV